MSAMEVTTDFKDPARIVDRDALYRAMMDHYARGGKCIACRYDRAEDPHHILFKSARGDDVAENIAPLCAFCHRMFHYGPTDEQREAAASIGKGLPDESVLYVLRKMGEVAGADYLLRRYHRHVGLRLLRVVRDERRGANGELP